MNRTNEKNTLKPKYRAIRIALAGGGTGGHLFPGIAIAREFETRNRENAVIFVSTGNPLEKRILTTAGYALECISAEGFKGRGIWNQAHSLLKIPRGVWESIRVLKRFKPDLVFGLGSYAAGPVLLAARLLGMPIVLHEANIIPGITNRLLSRFVDRVYSSFEETGKYVKARNIVWTGNPIRQDIMTAGDANQDKGDMSPDQKRFTVLIIGGSQGAHSINMAVIDALTGLDQKDRLYFVHQTGREDEDMVRSAYEQQAISGRVDSFFDDMAKVYSQADLIICRAGATTVAEITTLGKAALFIPFPQAADDHQTKNAKELVNQEAADMVSEKQLTPQLLSDKIGYYATHPNRLQQMAANAARLGKPDAAERIVDDCYRLLEA